MKKISIIPIAIAIISLFSACTDLGDDLYDRIPSADFPENETQAALMMIPVFKPLQDYCDVGGYWYAQEIPGDAITAPTRGTDWDDGGKWRALHQHTWSNDVEAINSMWYRFYKGSYEANKLIEYLQPAIDEGNDAAKATVAKAKVMRCFYYWNAIDNYGDVPYVTSYSEAPEQPTKESREVIWQALVDELEAVLPSVPAEGSKYTATKGMAYMLLAKLYINAEVYTGTPQWAKADEYLDSLIALGAYSLESDALAPFVTNNEASSENIFTIGYDENTYTGFNLHMRTLHYQSQATFNMSVQPWNGYAAMEDFYNSFSDDDRRKDMFLIGKQYSYDGSVLFDDGANGDTLIFTANIPALKMTSADHTLNEIRMSGARVVKFEIESGASANLSNDFPIFRYADALLMKAETQVRMNGAGAGDEYVNMIRTRAGLSEISGAGLDEILDERGKELVWEAQRRMDLIRFGKFGDAWWEKPASSPDRTIFPIPQWAIDANPNLAN